MSRIEKEEIVKIGVIYRIFSGIISLVIIFGFIGLLIFAGDDIFHWVILLGFAGQVFFLLLFGPITFTGYPIRPFWYFMARKNDPEGFGHPSEK